MLNALIRVFRIDAYDAENLHRPAGRARAASPQPELLGPRSSPDVLRLIASWNVPALVLVPRHDVLAANQLGNALLSANQRGATCLFDPARKFYVDWDEITESSAAALRAYADLNPDDPGLTRLIVESVKACGPRHTHAAVSTTPSWSTRISPSTTRRVSSW
ncbi:MmyB family transcriptional regulator [Streptomyces sp. SD15]